jgi:hypothetical protein
MALSAVEKMTLTDLGKVIQYVTFRPCGKCGAKPKYFLERRPESPDSPRPWGARWQLIFQCLGHGAEFGLKAAFDFHDVTPERPLESSDMVRDWVKMVGRIRPFAQRFCFYRWEHSSRAHRPRTSAL